MNYALIMSIAAIVISIVNIILCIAMVRRRRNGGPNETQ